MATIAQERALKRARKMLAHQDEPKLEVALYDALTDLRHLAQARGWDFDTALRISAYHHQHEDRT